jgi:hypothetical protein
MSSLELFSWDYHAVADEMVVAALPDPTTVPAEADPEEVVRGTWLTAIQAINQRLATDIPTDADCG